MSKKVKTTIIAAAVLLVLVAGLLLLKNVFSADTQKGQKNITVTVIYGEEKTEYNISTKSEYLGDALLERMLVTEAQYESAFYTEIDGITADYGKDGAWWCFNKDGQMLQTGVNETPIKDGEKYEAVYTVG